MGETSAVLYVYVLMIIAELGESHAILFEYHLTDSRNIVFDVVSSHC